MTDINRNTTIGYNLALVAGMIKNKMNSLLYPSGITIEQYSIMIELQHGQVRTQKQLSELTRKDEPNIARIIGRLEHNDLITRCVDTIDKRIRNVMLTDKGEKLLIKIRPSIEMCRDEYLDGLSLEHKNQLAEILSIIERNFHSTGSE